MAQQAYDEHLEFLLRQPDEIMAEIKGFKDAQFYDAPAFSGVSERLKHRYDQGFSHGKFLLSRKDCQERGA